MKNKLLGTEPHTRKHSDNLFMYGFFFFVQSKGLPKTSTFRSVSDYVAITWPWRNSTQSKPVSFLQNQFCTVFWHLYETPNKRHVKPTKGMRTLFKKVQQVEFQDSQENQSLSLALWVVKGIINPLRDTKEEVIDEMSRGVFRSKMLISLLRLY